MDNSFLLPHVTLQSQWGYLDLCHLKLVLHISALASILLSLLLLYYTFATLFSQCKGLGQLQDCRVTEREDGGVGFL